MATQPVFHMDVTKVVSADSYASELLNHFIPQNVDARTDPNGESDFLQLVALSTNNVLLQYRPAKAQRGALSAMCSAISTGTRSLKDPMPPPLNSPGTVTQDALDVVDAYARFESTNKQRLIEWVQFQTWDEDIQKVFWDTNRLQELGDALEVYRAGSAGTAIFEHALIDDRMLTFAPDEVQRALQRPTFTSPMHSGATSRGTDSRARCTRAACTQITGSGTMWSPKRQISPLGSSSRPIALCRGRHCSNAGCRRSASAIARSTHSSPR